MISNVRPVGEAEFPNKHRFYPKFKNTSTPSLILIQLLILENENNNNM